jgi:hypothetical protein
MDAFASVDSQVGKGHKQTDTQRDWQVWRSGGGGSKPREGAETCSGADEEDKSKSSSRGNDKKRLAPSPSAAEEDAVAERGASDRWIPLQEPGTGESYWFNTQTGATRRDPPGTDLDDGESSRSSAAVAAGGRGAKRQAINPILQAQAALERHLAAAATARGVAATGEAGRSAQQVAIAAAADHAGAWVEGVDPLSRNTYYTNRVSGETRWERPAALGPPAGAASPAAATAAGALAASADASIAGAGAPQPARKLTWTRGIEDGKPFWLCRETGETRFSKPPS